MAWVRRADGSRREVTGDGIGHRRRVQPWKADAAREMRAAPTPTEALLWAQLRSKRLGWFKFRRQAILFGWIVDFWCPSAALVVEVDGASHRGREHEDQRRDQALAREGIRTIRLSAWLVRSDLDGAVDRVRLALESR